jgi:predicted HicB family RNase H-like nuclease
MGKVTQFLWRLFRKATEEKPEPRFVMRRGVTTGAYAKTTIRIPKELLKAYKHAALERHTTLSYLIEEALHYYLKEVLQRKR